MRFENLLDPESNDGHDRLISGGRSDRLVRILQYEVREGREAGELVILPKAFIANCNQTCILRLEGFSDGSEDQVSTGARAEAEVADASA